MLKEFKAFALRGNVIDLAIGVIIGVAFGAIVTSFVNDIVMPIIGLLVGGVDFSDLFINLGDGEYASLAAAREAGAPGIAYGAFINTINQLSRMLTKPAAPAAPPAPTKSEVLLAEIRDLLKQK